MPNESLEEYKKNIKERLASFRHIFKNASAGDYSHNVIIPEKDDEFRELALGIQVMIEAVRGRVNDLEAEVAGRKHQASHDPLTGFPNRRAFEERSVGLFEQALLDGKKMAFLYLDVDRFKQVNDVFGHLIGDTLLQEFARRVKSCIREEDMIGRLGGDEFVIILRDIKDQNDVLQVVNSIIKALESPVELEARKIFLSTSIGVAMFPHDGQTTQSLIANSDVALLRAKQAGRNHYKFYEAAMNKEASSRLNVVQELRHALTAKEMRLHYQPIVNAVTQKILGVEALLRWQHPERGLIPAADFISIAEEHGIMKMLDEETLKNVFAQQSEWQKDGTPPIRISINLSPREFTDSRFIEKVKRLLSENHIDPSLLQFEIVENLAMENIALARERFKLLRKMGITIAIDDFGIGYSSLSYLKDLPIDTLKIDQSFIKHSMQSPQNQAIIRAIIVLGHSMHVNVIAEGVESEEQLRFLRALDCDGVQGRYIAHPMPAEMLAEWTSRFEPIV